MNNHATHAETVNKIISLRITVISGPPTSPDLQYAAITVPLSQSTEAAVRALMNTNQHGPHAPWSAAAWRRGTKGAESFDFKLESDRAVYEVLAIERDVPHRAEAPEFITE